ncbi:MAG TPA: Rne/Rng family ribonuclease [Candidatus Acidoferrales bacterium]|nr:Rne/Rng family ribonuclease [Candidatus Acidoferrales bacterium]
MSKEMVISANPHETRVAIMEEGQLCEYYVEREKEFALVGSIYKGRVTRVLPGMQSSFVDIGLDSDAFLYVTDFLEGIEELDEHVAAIAEEKSSKAADAGAQAAIASDASAPSFEPANPPPAAEPLAAAYEGPAPEPGNSAEIPAAPPAMNPAPPDRTAPPNRGRFDRPNRGGRDFGRRGGRGGGRLGRRGGGGGRGGDRRYGRELPPSKYASPRSYDERPGESAPGEGHVSTILPGESFAKYKDKPVFEAAPAAQEDTTRVFTPMEASEPSDPAAVAPPAAPVETPEANAEPERHGASEFRREFRAEPRPQTPRSFSAGLEPLPGETLSKWKHREAPVEGRAEAASPAEIPEHLETPPAPEEPEFRSAEPVHEEHAAPELSEEEAAALAEHVAEAQDEEAARAAQERAFSAADEAAEATRDAAEDEPEAHDAESAADEDEADAEAENQDVLHSLEDTEHSLEADAGVAPTEDGLPIPAESPLAQGQPPWKARVHDDFRARMQHPARRGRDRGRRDDRGRRPQHGHGGHGHYRSQPRRPQLIADLLKQGQEIIVQIAKEPLGKKGARITSHVALPGRYLVYMPTLDHTGVSRKIALAEDRARLRHLVNEAKGSAGGGFIVRTAAGTAAPEEVRADVEFLTRTWAEIKARSEQRKAPSLLHRDLNLVERMLRDHMSSDYTAIWVDSEEEYTKVVEFMGRFQPGLVNRVKLYTKENPVFEEFGIQQEIDKGLRPKVWLKSGGYIVINHTEALVAIDVNTGKFVGKGSNRLEDTIVRTNLEATKEIVRQMRLRDLGGIIVIDFIDMEDRRNREKVMAALEDALKADRAPSKMLRFNEFGLIAITRKRTKQALERMLTQPCPYCTGSGMVKSIPTLCYEIQTEARKMAGDLGSGSLTLRVHPEVAKALKTRESGLVEELERWTKKSVIIQADPTLHWEQYDIY